MTKVAQWRQAVKFAQYKKSKRSFFFERSWSNFNLRPEKQWKADNWSHVNEAHVVPVFTSYTIKRKKKQQYSSLIFKVSSRKMALDFRLID